VCRFVDLFFIRFPLALAAIYALAVHVTPLPAGVISVYVYVVMIQQLKVFFLLVLFIPNRVTISFSSEISWGKTEQT
jgi:hypothetical protein